ncbi:MULTISPECIES: efflux RND transporter periplasmic adaptor subunit [Ramlibacter]|uniref:Efflux RND transporter periplasmic adaptor subunit n=1 Tax=Ramlibacter pinisoli TaxID=2682844 RepID=A0A6N8IPN8_9BURK|nr:MULTISPECIES: efflux RND transporter periplasmic adaptor subunit [Ramlibacter]MBA2963875.1 efflux RND transporter periplasmic adaptor subunit [Ramlibacter sp. CGMCC 1.13660]MVQ28841.1 efflux RND transporter periplasmic adaptor subunit [Ramlibacter pinisoli]
MKNKFAPLARHWWAVASLGAAAAAALVAFGPERSAQAAAPAAAPAGIPVSVATVNETEITAWNEFSGRLEAVERVDIRSRVAGAVQSVHFREGSLVAKGDLLVTIDPAPYAAEVERAEAQVGAAQARLTNADNEHVRALRLWEDSAIARRELDERVNARREAEANLRAAQAQSQAARLNLGYTQVRAPVAGRIGKLEVTPGNLVAAGPGAPVLTTLVSVSPIYASFEADEQTLVAALKTLPSGSSARQLIERIPVQMATALGADVQHAGRLQLIDNQVDARSGTVRMRATFDNKDGSLIPGQFARIRMGQPQAVRALLVNERAVGTDQDKKFVLVVGPGDKAEYREVTLGAPVDGLRVVRSGLRSGERIVVNGLQRVRPGAVVQPETVEMTARPAGAATVAAKS